MEHRRPISLRARLTRIAYRAFLKRPQGAAGIDDIRRGFRRLERLVPPPPRGTTTTRIALGGVTADLVATRASRPDRHLLYLHGGAYAFGSPRLYRHFTWRMAEAARVRVLVLDYRLAPEHPFPAALEDAVGAWLWLIGQGAAPERAAIAGDSAGGGLALATLVKLRDDGRPLPAAAVAMSPWTDLALTGASMRANAGADPMLVAADVPRFAAAYLGGADARDPYASPLYADPRGLPPTLMQAGSDEILRDDAVRMAERMRAAGCAVELQIWPKMVHTWQLLTPVLPEARAALADIARFLDSRLG